MLHYRVDCDITPVCGSGRVVYIFKSRLAAVIVRPDRKFAIAWLTGCRYQLDQRNKNLLTHLFRINLSPVAAFLLRSNQPLRSTQRDRSFLQLFHEEVHSAEKILATPLCQS